MAGKTNLRQDAESASRPARVVHFETVPWQRDYLTARLPGLDQSFQAGTLDDAAVAALTPAERDAEIVSIFIRSNVSRSAIERLPNLRLVAARSTGFDRIDLDCCNERGIAVANVPAYGENTVAEHTFALILTLTRKVHKAYIRTTRGDFSLDGLEGVDLKDRTLGVVGTGRIGLHAIRIAKGFGMNVLAFDVKPAPILAEVLGFQYVPLDDLLHRSDIVSLHVPLLPQTRHLMNRERFSQMKPGAFLVNTARGGVVDTDALIWALDEGILGGAGLDVIEGEELVGEEDRYLDEAAAEEKLRVLALQHVLLLRENVILTPHMAFFSREAEERILETTAENITGFLAGQPRNVVNAPAGAQRKAA
jgi:D-lactate dehydrogenase